MNPKEAIKTIEIAMAEVEWEYPMDYQVAFETAIEALKLKDELMQEISNFKEVISANYEMFMKYDVNDHTEIEQIAFDNFDKTVQDLQWLVDRLECDTE